MKKILVLASTFPRSEKDTQPGFVKHLCSELAKTCHVTVLLPHAPGTVSKEKMGDIDIHRYHYFLPKFETLTYGSGILSNLKAQPIKGLLIPFFFLGQLIALINLISKEHWAAIHAHWIIPQGLVAILARSLTCSSIPVLVTSHGADLFALQGRLLTFLKKVVLRRANAVSVVSSAMKDYCIKELGIEEHKIDVLSMGVDLKHTFTINKELDRNNNCVIFVGRLVEKKGVEYLIKAFQLVVQQQPQAQLTIIGSGSLELDLKVMTTAFGLDNNVSFLGAIENRDLPIYFNKNAIAVVPSIIGENGDQEGLGLVMIEAIGCGCTVIASDLPAIKDVIKHEDTGLLVRQKSPDEIANSILRLMNDQIFCKALSERSLAFVHSRFDWTMVGHKYRLLLDALVPSK